MLVSVQLPDGASLERTRKALDQVSTIAGKDPSVAQVIAISGISVLDNSAPLANAGVAYVVLKDWSERDDLRTIFARLTPALDAVDGRVNVLPPPPIQGIGNAGGFTLQIELRDGSTDFAKLQSMTNAVVANAQSQSALQRVATSFRATAPQLRIDVDRVKARDRARAGRSGVFDARHLSRLDLCRAVQQVRPRVSDLCAGRCAIPAAAARHRKSLGAQSARQHDSARHAGEGHAGRRHAADQPLQSLSVVDRHRPAGGGLLVGRGDPFDGGECGEDAAARRRQRMDGDVLPGEDRRQSDVFRVRDGDAAGLSGARRPIRELVRAARGHPLGAAGADRAGSGARSAAHRQQSLHPDRL